MKTLNRISTKWQLMIACSLLLIIPVSIIGYIGYKSTKTSLYEQIENSLQKQALTLQKGIKNTYAITQEKIDTDLKIAHETLYSLGQPNLDKSASGTVDVFVTNQITQEGKNITIPTMKIGNEKLIFNHKITDKIQNLVGNTATIFQIIPDGLLRISTNETKLDETKTIGTYIPNDSPEYKSIMNGKTYTGRTNISNKWYFTSYEPILDGNNNVIGALYLGINENNFQELIKNSLSELTIGKTGYIYILRENGEYVLSLNKKRDGENIWEAKDSDGKFFIQEIINKGKKLQENETAITYYPWQNNGEKKSRMKLAGYSYFPEWNWIIASSAYQEDFLDNLATTRNEMLLIGILTIIAGVIFSYLFSSFITNQQKIGDSFLANLPDPGFKTDKNLIITQANDALLKTLGYSRKEVIGKMTCADICKTPICKTDKCTIKNCMKNGKTIVAETTATTRDGKKIPIRAACGALKNKEGKAVGGFEIISDLSDNYSLISNIEKVAEGDLTINIDKNLKKKEGSIGKLAKSVDKMIENFKKLIFNLKSNISSTAASSEQLSSSTEEINAAMQQIYSAVQQVAAGAKNVSESAVESRNISKKTEENARQGSTAATTVSNKMSNINTSTTQSSQKIAQLGEKSKEIGSIVDTIKNITKQTNLLALNASIEAARAGDAGRGFAVVADEVRKLAEESEKATGQIHDLANKIQADIKSSVEDMQNNSTQVEDGSKAITQAVKSFEEIPELINNINTSLSNMAAIAEQNAAGSGEMSSAIQQITASMQQISSTAQSLNGGAEGLKDMISGFKISTSQLENNQKEEVKASTEKKEEEK